MIHYLTEVRELPEKISLEVCDLNNVRASITYKRGNKPHRRILIRVGGAETHFSFEEFAQEVHEALDDILGIAEFVIAEGSRSVRLEFLVEKDSLIVHLLLCAEQGEQRRNRHYPE